MGTWLNSDGLFLRFGKTEGIVGGSTGIGWAAEYSVMNGRHMTEIVLPDLTLLTTTGVIVDDTVTIPNGARVEEVKVITFTAATSLGSATLDIGFIDQDRATTFDDDGLLAAVAMNLYDAAGETNTFSVSGSASGAGALVGTTLTNTGLIVASYNTAAYTAGALKIQVFWSVPVSSTSP